MSQNATLMLIISSALARPLWAELVYKSQCLYVSRMYLVSCPLPCNFVKGSHWCGGPKAQYIPEENKRTRRRNRRPTTVHWQFGFSPTNEGKPANEKKWGKDLNATIVIQNRYSILTNGITQDNISRNYMSGSKKPDKDLGRNGM